MSNYNNKELKELLIKKVKEKYIADIIISFKQDIEQTYHQRLYKEWNKEVRKLRIQLEEAKNNVKGLQKIIKKNCKHTDVTEEISPGWERASHDYRCNQCGFYVQIHDEFDYRNITKKIDY